MPRLIPSISTLGWAGVAVAAGLLLLWGHSTRERARDAVLFSAPSPDFTVLPGPEAATLARQELARLRASILAFREIVGRPPSLDELRWLAWRSAPNDPTTLRPSTASRAVSSYCSPLTQESLSGDSADWHSCWETGRVLACGGNTSEGTARW